MKKRIWILIIVLAAITSLAFDRARTSIIGRINPVDGGGIAWLISKTDTLETSISQGQFGFDVKPGVYTLLIDSRDPYRDILMENLNVKLNETLDLGEIPLRQ